MEGHKLPDIIVVGLQEIISLGGKHLVQSNEKLMQTWESIFNDNI